MSAIQAFLMWVLCDLVLVTSFHLPKRGYGGSE